MNVNDGKGQVWIDGEPVTDTETLDELLTLGRQIWVYDSYWLVMPFKLLDPGVTLRYSGERELEDGRTADVLDLTFAEVGYTPDNRYEVFVVQDTGLIEAIGALFGGVVEQHLVKVCSFDLPGP